VADHPDEGVGGAVDAGEGFVEDRDDALLLVRELADDGRWTLPGGWADPNESPGEAVVREVWEETGYETRATDYAETSQLDREDEAKKVLAELGYGPDKPLKMEIRFNTSENHKNTAVAIQEQLKPLGIEVSLVNTDTKTHYGLLEQKGDFDIARAGWIADYKDPENFLALCKTGTGNNYAVYSNKDYDDLMAGAAAAATPEERMKLLSDAEAIGVARDLCVVPLLYYSYHTLVSNKLKGWEDNVMDVHPTRFLAKE
jgi:oligopeptide transport system substrate-binding protein